MIRCFVTIFTLLVLFFLLSTWSIAQEPQPGDPTPELRSGTVIFLPLIIKSGTDDQEEVRAENIDDLFAKVAKQEPGFGGMYIDEDKDILYVYMLGGDPEKAVAALRDVFGEENLPDNVQVLSAKFSFLQLKEWHDRLIEQVFKIRGVTLIDINDAENRLTVGVVNKEVGNGMKKRGIEFGVPVEAVNIIETGPIEPATGRPAQVPDCSSLTAFCRPLVGGLQIQHLTAGGDTISLCTLSFIAVRNGVRGFVTNSHCSASRGARDGTVYYQPTLVVEGETEIEDDFQIGVETIDPRGRPCKSILRCRESDSNFSRFEVAPPDPDDLPGETPPEVPANRGFIARPPLDSVAWDGVSTFRIVREATASAFFVGRVVTKVGMITGRTEGEVTQTGVTIKAFIFQGLLLRNQVLATYRDAKGDSGAPVIRAHAPDPSGNQIDTTLLGIHWGEQKKTGLSVFSPIHNVEADLGPLNTCAPPTKC